MKTNRTAEIGLFLLRVVAGFLFMQHGGQKLFGWYGGFGESGGSAPLMSQMGLAGILEFFGGLLLVLGLLTRPVAFLVSGEMAVAYFQAHVPRGGLLPLQNHGEAAALFAFIFLFFAAEGAGKWSLDALLHRGPKHHRDEALEEARTMPKHAIPYGGGPQVVTRPR